MFSVIPLLALIFLSLPLYAQHYFSGSIKRDTRWTGDIYINGDVTIHHGVILSIEGGSRIFFKPKTDKMKSGIDKERAEIIVYGTLLARGANEQTPIIFTSESQQAQMNDWYGIIIKNLYDTSILENCIIEYAYKGITCYGSSPLITKSQIRFNYNSGISCEVRATSQINQCVVMENGFAGINCELAAAPKISETIITQNKYGVVIFSRSEPDLGRYPPIEGKSIGKNHIFNNFDFDIYNHSVKNIYAQNNFWNTSNSNEIRFSIYDDLENPSSGHVIFEPIFLRKKKNKLSVPSITIHKQKKFISNQTSSDTFQKTGVFKNQQMTEQPQILPSIQRSGSTPASEIIKNVWETDYAFQLISRKENIKSVKKESNTDGTILEIFADATKREYFRCIKSAYTSKYFKTDIKRNVHFEKITDPYRKIADYHVFTQPTSFSPTQYWKHRINITKPREYHRKTVK